MKLQAQDTTKGRHELVHFERRIVVDVAGVLMVESLDSRYAEMLSSIMSSYTKKNDTVLRYRSWHQDTESVI